jgi:hypothetical protein
MLTRWQPDLAAAVNALASRGTFGPSELYEFRDEFLDDARAVLDASGANAEIERLRAVLHAAHGVIATLREENQYLLSLALALTLEPVIADMPSDEELRDAAIREGFLP